jgi:hypothetical protein
VDRQLNREDVDQESYEAPLWVWLMVIALAIGVMCAATWGGKAF